MGVREISCSRAVAEALMEEMERDETVFVIGEDLVSSAGIFGQLDEPAVGHLVDQACALKDVLDQEDREDREQNIYHIDLVILFHFRDSPQDRRDGTE